MKEKMFYIMILIIYLFIDVLIYFISSMQGDTIYFVISLIATLMLWYLTIKIIEKREMLSDKTSKISTLFDYFDVESVIDLLKLNKSKKNRFDVFDGNDDEKKITILTIKLLNYEEINMLQKEQKLEVISYLLSIIDQVIKKKYGIIYEIKNDTIVCIFDVVYEIPDSELEAIKCALNINLCLMKLREKKKGIKKLILNMSVVNQEMDFFIKGKRVLIYGDLSLAEELVNIDGYDSIMITNDIFNKYNEVLDSEYLGKYYINKKEEKLHKVNSIKNDEEYELNVCFEKSKLKIKRGMDKTLQDFASKIKKG